MNWTLSWQDALRLARLPVLPTVWTNLLAGLVLAGGSLLDVRALLLFAALTLFHLAGSYLNDAFDAPSDADARPERPIPAGRAGRAAVFTLGFVMLALALAPLLPAGMLMDPIDYAGTNYWPLACGGLLAAAILLYDWRHRGNPWGPTILGACRALAYLTAGLAIMVPPPPPLLIGAAMLFCYLLGFGYLARHRVEAEDTTPWPFFLFLAAPLIYGLGLVAQRPHILLFWVAFAGVIGVAHWLMRRDQPGDLARAVITLTAGIALYDALLIAGTGALGLAALALLGFVATLVLHRLLPEQESPDDEPGSDSGP